MSKRFSEEVARLNAQLEAPRSEQEIERGRRRLFEALEHKRPRRTPLLVPAIALICVLLFLVLRPKENEGLVIASGAECVERSARSISIDSCGSEVELSVGIEAEDLTLTRGRARFSVKKRDTSRFQITVSHGTIVVIGTRFVVEQRDRSGRVDVEDGIVEFRWSDGSPAERLVAGDSLEWPRPPPAPEKTETATKTELPPPKKVPPPPRAKRPSAKELMQRLFQLKSQQRFDEAIELLSEGSRRKDFSEVQRERLSFELGVVLRQSGRSAEACQHFRRHLARFPASPRKKEIADTCPP